MNSLRMLDQEEENGDTAEVTWEDQQRINLFSKLNTRLRSVEEKLEELKAAKDALDDLYSELELLDEAESVLYKVGEAFLHIPHARAIIRLEKDQAVIDTEVSFLENSVEECAKEMKELKVLLYAKFGRSINLDD